VNYQRYPAAQYKTQAGIPGTAGEAGERGEDGGSTRESGMHHKMCVGKLSSYDTTRLSSMRKTGIAHQEAEMAEERQDDTGRGK
jgi:hypothetical protein